MVRYGEYSPLNPTLLSPGKTLLGLGEYEEKRQRLLQQKKREYLDHLEEARSNSSGIPEQPTNWEGDEVGATAHRTQSEQLPVPPLAVYPLMSPRERKMAELRESYDGVVDRDMSQVQAARQAAYHEELRKQIEERRRLEEEQRERERKEDEAMARRIAQQQEEMRREYEREEAARRHRQEQRMLNMEEYRQRQAQLKHEAEDERKRRFHQRLGKRVPDSFQTNGFNPSLQQEATTNHLMEEDFAKTLQQRLRGVTQDKNNNNCVESREVQTQEAEVLGPEFTVSNNKHNPTSLSTKQCCSKEIQTDDLKLQHSSKLLVQNKSAQVPSHYGIRHTRCVELPEPLTKDKSAQFPPVHDIRQVVQGELYLPPDKLSEKLNPQLRSLYGDNINQTHDLKTPSQVTLGGAVQLLENATEDKGVQMPSGYRNFQDTKHNNQLPSRESQDRYVHSPPEKLLKDKSAQCLSPQNTQAHTVDSNTSLYSQPSSKHGLGSTESSILQKLASDGSLTFCRPRSSRNDSVPVPLLCEDSSTFSRDAIPFSAQSDPMNRTEAKWRVPAVQKNVVQPSRTERPRNVLTQLGAFRKQMQLEQLRMDQQLRGARRNE